MFFDNWFTGTELKVAQWKQGIACVGTVHGNHLRGGKLPGDKVLRKEDTVMCAVDTDLNMVQRPTTANLEMPFNTGNACFEDPNLHDISDNLSTDLFWSIYTISKSPADGHF